MQKWDVSARATIIIQKTHGMPFHRLEKLQAFYEIPVAESTLWHQCEGVWNECGEVIFNEMFKMAANCDLIHVDDTGAKILEVIKENKKLPETEKPKECHTTTIYATTVKGENIVLYMTSQKYAGENLTTLLKERDHVKRCVRVMVDASWQNKAVIKDGDKIDYKKIVYLYCLVHARRQFFDILNYYPEECGYFLDQIEKIYKNDNHCRLHGYSGRKRLKYHKQHSGPLIKNIYRKINEWLNVKKRVEPNSDLGNAMKYWLRYKKGLIKFLYRKNCPLDNNVDERSVRPFILQRKNSMFFKTREGARIGSGLHSIVQTCYANNINGFRYLIWLQENWIKAKERPQDYTPFAYKKYLNETECIAKAA